MPWSPVPLLPIPCPAAHFSLASVAFLFQDMNVWKQNLFWCKAVSGTALIYASTKQGK